MASSASYPIHFVKGRGAGSNRQSRFLENDKTTEDDSFQFDNEGHDEVPSPSTIVTDHKARTIISRNDSPDIGFEQSINPYLGCEHGCAYCYARPSHAYIGLSPGLDFESKIFAKKNAAHVLRTELSRPGYAPATIALGANTDPYQPAERTLRISRSIIEVLRDFNAPVSITTKSALVARDIDILADMASHGLVRVNISIATLDADLARRMDPRAPTPDRRLRAIEALAAANIPVAVFTSPVILGLTDIDIEKVLARAAEAGAKYASYVMLRLPLEVRDIFIQWLTKNFPLRAQHVMSLVMQSSGGKEYESRFGLRMKGTGIHADMVAQRFKIATTRLGLNRDRLVLDSTKFAIPGDSASQLNLF